VPVSHLPECARHIACDVRVPSEPGAAGGRPHTGCTRRARFAVVGRGRPALYACPRHVQMAVIGRVMPVVLRRRRRARGALAA